MSLPDLYFNGTEYIELDYSMGEKATFKMQLWGIFASALFVAGIITLSIGINKMFKESILTVAADNLGASSIVNTLNWLTTGITIFIIVSDVILLLTVFLLNPRDFQIWKLRYVKSFA